MSESHAAIAYCPYCGDEDLHPVNSDSPGWECRSCLRVFRVSMLGLAPRPSTDAAHSSHEIQGVTR